MTVGLLTEKPSAARAFAAALGGASGTYNGEAYVIAHARGHLYELDQPQTQLGGATAAEQEAMRLWNIENLPWDLGRFEWSYVQMPDAGALVKEIKTKLAGCDEIVVATDVDPTGEGGLIFANIAKALGFDKTKKISRMYFTDEAPASLQKAFRERKVIPDLEQFDEYKMASYRSAWDFASMQWTRVASAMARASGTDTMLRQGRLKSAMVALVGDQLKAYNDYVKKSFFQNRFRDEHGVVYTNPDEPRFDDKASVPNQYGTSPVVLDSRAEKRTAPPRLLDLAALSSMLSGKGVKPAMVLSTYQKMYEDQVVSYPRTEDKHITTEQFKELLPLLDKIAGVVGVDPALLTVRSPRKTHVKDSGAHGANRPGPKVPNSLRELEAKYGKAAPLIYEILAKNYLAMTCEDFLYERQEGHLERYEAFKGAVNVPKSLGWKAVFNTSTDEPDEDESDKGLGTMADPFVFEGANKRPEHPTMKWLMKQLEKRDVGTGATRTSTYAEVTSEKTKHPLLVDRRGKITLAEAGQMSHLLLPGTRIGDLSLTEQVYADMKAIASGTKTAAECLAVVADWVVADIAQMQRNAAAMRTQLGLIERDVSLERASGVWQGRDVSFKRSFSGHDFTDEEVAALLAGEEIEFRATSAKTGNDYTARGKLAEQTYQGRKFVGFKPDFGPKKDANGRDLPPPSWCGVKFSPAELDKLVAGESIHVTGALSRKTGKKFDCTLTYKEEKGAKRLVPSFD